MAETEGFTHLHVHTEYSLLDGACRIKKLVEHVRELGQTAVAITDHGNMYGVIEFYKAAKEAGIKPIIGCEVYVASRSRLDKTFDRDNESTHLILLCKNKEGYQNLIKMVSLGYIEGFYNRPRIDMELLRRHSGGLIACSACIAGQIPRKILANDYDGAKALAEEYRAIFGEGNFYLEMQEHHIPEQGIVNAALRRISDETGIPLTVSNDAHYLTKEDSFAQDVLMCIQTNHTVDDDDRMKLEPTEFYIKSTAEMAELFPDCPDALANTARIANMCELEFDFGTYHLPRFTLPDGRDDAKIYLAELCEAGFVRRYPDALPEHRERLEYELGVINSMGFTDYFLIVADFIGYAKQNGIPVGPGRGSGAGSIAAYCLGITEIDPIKYSLFFERFLNPERVSMPDFDVDFCPNRRQEVIDYVTRKYGADCVAQIVTFGTMAARGAIRDVGRALGIPYAEVDLLAKLVPFELHMTIERALEISPKLKEMYLEDARLRRLIDTAMLLEGMPRHTSTHAAGVVVTARPVMEYVPLATNDDTIVTQFSMTTVEELGLLKIDFLGLRNLTVIDDAAKEIRKRMPDFDIAKIPDDDVATFKMLADGRTVGVFQLETTGMTGVCTGLKAQSIEEIMAIIALYRPGPMDSIPRYINGKLHPESVTYGHPLLEPILNVTYGCIVYQEQVMEIFRRLAGYSLGRADIVRRAMSKKKMDVLARERENFIHGNESESIRGCVPTGVPEDVADKLFDDIREFANYAFNKAHAACYAVVAYQTAYLKCNYTREYMAALLTSVLGDTGKIAEYIAACREAGIRVLPPDIQSSSAGFTVSGNDIRFGLVALKNVGAGFIDALSAERTENGQFLSFQQFCERMFEHDLNRRAVEALIKCGAMDCFGISRAALLMMYGRVIDAIAIHRKTVSEDQMGFFGTDEDDGLAGIEPPRDVQELSLRERLLMEKETTGMYLSGHPMDEYADVAKKAGAVPIRDIIDENRAIPDDDEAIIADKTEKIFRDGQNVLLIGVITAVKSKTTKNNSQMAYVRIEDMSGDMELLCFSRVLNECAVYVREGNAIAVRGKLSLREDEEPKLIADVIAPAGQPPAPSTKAPYSPPKEPVPQSMQGIRKIYLRFNEENRERLDRVACLLRFVSGDDSGTVKVIFYDNLTKQYTDAPEELWSDSDPRTIRELKRLLGDENVVAK